MLRLSLPFLRRVAPVAPSEAMSALMLSNIALLVSSQPIVIVGKKIKNGTIMRRDTSELNFILIAIAPPYGISCSHIVICIGLLSGNLSGYGYRLTRPTIACAAVLPQTDRCRH